MAHMQQMLVAGGAGVVRLEDHTVSQASNAVSITFNSDGSISLGTGDSALPAINSDEWLNIRSTGVGLRYEIQATLLSGTFAAGDFATWESLSTNQIWSATGGNVGSMTIEIRDAVTQTVLDSCSITLDGS